MLGILLGLVAIVTGIGSLVCFVLVLVEMFKRQQTGLAIACIVLAFCTGVGTLIAFVYGWMKSKEWGLQKVMLAWTVCFVLYLISAGVLFTSAMAQSAAQMKQMQREMQNMQMEDLKIEYK